MNRLCNKSLERRIAANVVVNSDIGSVQEKKFAQLANIVRQSSLYLYST